MSWKFFTHVTSTSLTVQLAPSGQGGRRAVESPPPAGSFCRGQKEQREVLPFVLLRAMRTGNLAADNLKMFALRHPK